MDITITPKKLQGSISVIPSKSQAHRLLICAAFSDSSTTVVCRDTNQDIDATVRCLNALGANITRSVDGFCVQPMSAPPESAMLHCGESGSTLRFLLPIAGALGVDATFSLEGRLAQRPLSPLREEMERMGCRFAWVDNNHLLCTGKLKAGHYSIDGSVSSQFITGLLFALSLIPGRSHLDITGSVESAPYIELTRDALTQFGVNISDGNITGQFPFRSAGTAYVEGDWSNGAFFHVANLLNNELTISELALGSKQGDRTILDILPRLSGFCQIDAADIPDLVPILSIAAACKSGAKFFNVRRLRLKESDRVESTLEMLKAFGIQAFADENTLTVFPGKLHSCCVRSYNDHRIAMSAGIAATAADGPVTILGAECVSKSYPTFWEEYRRLGGIYEQYLRQQN